MGHNQSTNDGVRYQEAQKHPYILYVAQLNMTSDFKQMLLAGNKEIEKYVPDREHYRELRRDFLKNYPEFEHHQLSDCILL
jgi:hypothetical protein